MKANGEIYRWQIGCIKAGQKETAKCRKVKRDKK
jgi:hypothetical protein